MSVIYIYCYIFKEIEENQELYNKKNDFWKKNLTFFLNFFVWKILYLIGISVKCINCGIRDLKKNKRDLVT